MSKTGLTNTMQMIKTQICVLSPYQCDTRNVLVRQYNIGEIPKWCTEVRKRERNEALRKTERGVSALIYST